MNGGVLIGTRVMFGRILVCSALADKGGALADKGAGASGPDGGYIDVEQGRMRRMP